MKSLRIKQIYIFLNLLFYKPFSVYSFFFNIDFCVVGFFLVVDIYRMSVIRTLTLLTIGATIALAQRRLALPDPRSCANRKCKHIHIFKKKLILDFMHLEFIMLNHDESKEPSRSI